MKGSNPMASVSIDDLWPQAVPGGIAFAAPEPASLDEDLTWILKGFVGRIMADGGIITHHGDETARTLAVTGLFHPGGALPTALMGATRAVAAANTRRMHGPEPLMVWSGADLADGGGRALIIPIQCMGGEQVVLTAVYQAGSSVAAEPAEAMASRLNPILGGYFRLWSKARTHARRAARIEAALDFGGIATAVLDRTGEVSFVNRAMRRLLEAGDGLRTHGRMLAGTDPAASVRLQLAVRQALAEAPAAGRAPSAMALFLRRPGRRDLLPVAVLAATFAPMEPDDVAVVVYAIGADGDLTEAVRPVCQAHGLSPVETSLVLRLTEGATLADAAVSLRIKEQTARAYLKQIFAKTEVSRQSDLIRLMLTSAVTVAAPLVVHR